MFILNDNTVYYYAILCYIRTVDLVTSNYFVFRKKGTRGCFLFWIGISAAKNYMILE